jgi:hypothetical protein
MPVGILNLRRVNPIIERKSASVIAEASAFCGSAVIYVGESSVISEAIQSSSGSKGVNSFSSVVGEAVSAPTHSNQKSSSSSVICEAVATDLFVADAGAIDIYDEGILVEEGVTCLDFRGTDVLAKEGSGTCVEVWVPAPAYVSHFNTSDGVTDGSVADISTSDRYISSPTTEGNPFYVDGWDDASVHPCTRTSPLSWSTAQDISFYNNATTFTLTLTGPQGTIESYTTIAITGDGSYDSGNISLTISGWAADSNKFRGSVLVTVDIETALGVNSGRFNLAIQHNNGVDGVFNYTQSDVFFDIELFTHVISGLTSTLNTAVTKRISGIYYMISATTFDFAIGDIDYSNSDSYPLTLITADLSDFGITPNPNINSGDLTSWVNDYDNKDSSWNNTLAINISNYRVCGDSAQFNATPQDWVAGSTKTASALQVLIDTYTDDATNGANTITENFIGESLRVTSGGVAWDSNSFLSSDDLLIHCSNLKTQQIDFTNYLPHNGTTIINPDYSAGGAANQFFYRFYTTNGLTRSGGVFTFNGGVEGDLGTDLLIDISLDGSDWYDATSDYLGGALTDGAGCRIPGDTMPDLRITLGTFTTNDASGIVPANSIMLRITMPDSSTVEIDTAHFAWTL